jgi:hypothetical protein
MFQFFTYLSSEKIIHEIQNDYHIQSVEPNNAIHTSLFEDEAKSKIENKCKQYHKDPRRTAVFIPSNIDNKTPEDNIFHNIQRIHSITY